MKPAFETSGFIKLLIQLWTHMSAKRKRQFKLLSILMLGTAFIEIVSLGSVIPFLGILTAPDLMTKNVFIKNVSEIFSIKTNQDLILALTIIFIFTAIVAGASRMILLWVSTRFAFASGADLSMEIYRRTLYQPYRVHVARNSSEVISGITTKVGSSVSVLNQLMNIFSSILLIFAITITLIIINPKVALISSVGFGTCYILISRFFRKRLFENSRHIAHKQTEMIKCLQEGLGGIRDVLLNGTQNVYCEIYNRADQPLRTAQGNNFFISGSPKFAMETLGMVLIAILAYVLSKDVGGISAAIPTLGALALGAQRLLPALQQTYSAWSNIMGNYASLRDTVGLLNQNISEGFLIKSETLPFQKSIQFENVSYRYREDGPWVLNNFNITIPKGSRVGFVGVTGSGKSTVLDLCMGLLNPTQGTILIDDKPIREDSLRSWQGNIAHVPQNIYLADSSLSENIAFGIPKNEINMERVIMAARQAQISQFIESRPEGYSAFVGERGIRLSGGQRQRIGIARALYRNANVLVFDEATSALDNATEKSVMSAIEGLNKDLTVLIIAHRLTTIRNCDVIVELDNGKIVASGTFNHLLQTSLSFKHMVNAI